jgi:Transglycosylase SLT domain
MQIRSWPIGIPALPSPIPLFAEHQAHPFVPLTDLKAAARSSGQGRSQTGACTLPLMAASPVADSFKFGRPLCFGSLRAFVLASLCFCALVLPARASSRAEGPPKSVKQYERYVAEAARRFTLPTRWIRGVMHVESAADVRAVSSAGAMGLMQIMPATWKELRVHHHLGPDPFDAHDNILAGAAYLRELYDRYGSPGFLAAYNAGPQRYEEYLAGRPLPRETLHYVAKLAPHSGLLNPRKLAFETAVNERSLTGSLLFVAPSDVVQLTNAQYNFDVVPSTSESDVFDARRQANSLFITRAKAVQQK